ncbi:MAG TPA: hypothetical protein VF294_03215 [Polyangiaceae bacterium]
MTEKRERVSTDPGLGPLDRPGPSTLRSIEAAKDLSSISPNAPVYYEPSPLVAVSDHRTLEVETVKLAENIDPRKLATEMRLGRVSSSLVPPSDSGWPPETALTSSTPPDGPGRRRRLARLVLFALLGVLLVVLVARAATRRSANAVGAPVATPAAVAASPQPTSTQVAPAPAATVADSVATTATAAEPSAEASAEPAHSESSRTTTKTKQHSAKSNPQPAARQPLTAASPSKPKRAIY